MRKLAHEVYFFDRFKLDLTRGALFRGVDEIKLRPKSFEVLTYLVQNGGRLVTKDEMIESVWQGMAVTDDSLVQCLKDIRHALDDKSQTIIRTVPRRGYVLDATVTENGSEAYTEETSGVHLVIEETLDGNEKPIGAASHRTARMPLLIAAASLVILTGVGYGAYVYFLRRPAVIFTSVTMKPLTTDGKATLAAISPDGKYVAFVAEEEPNRRSLWVRQVAAINPTRIIPADEVGYGGLTFSPDGSFIYLVRNESLFQIPTLGGSEPRKILDGVNSEISFSPDGNRFAFVRLGDGQGAGIRVMIANTDGNGEPQVIAVRKPPEVFRAGCDWSPDGKRLACTGGDNQLFGQMYPVIVNIADGAQTPMQSRTWNLVGQKEWLADGSGFVMDAFAGTGVGPQIWFVPYPDGDARQVYSNPNAYWNLSMTADSGQIVAVERSTRLNVYSLEITQPRKQPVKLSVGTIGRENVNTSISDGKIVFVSEADGDRDIWLMNADGSNRQQLTFGPPMDSDASVSPDDRQIAFARAGLGIWTMDLDGANKRQLAKLGMFPEYSADGASVFYTLPRERWSLWKTSIEGGESVRVTEHPGVQPAVSPDGRFIAYMRFATRNDAQLYVADANTLQVAKIFEAKPRAQFEIEWTPDSSSIVYNSTADGIDQLVRQPLDGGPPQVMIAERSELETIGGFTFSRDGRFLYYSAGPIDHNVVLFTLER